MKAAFVSFVISVVVFRCVMGLDYNDESQLHEDLLYWYNKVARPVKNSSDKMVVKFGASLIRIIDLENLKTLQTFQHGSPTTYIIQRMQGNICFQDEKSQQFTTNVWLEMNWFDKNLVWDPEKYGGVKKLYVPTELIWIPDIILYNHAGGSHTPTSTDAVVYYDGTVLWQPPAIYLSFCPIDIAWFPFDSQKCELKFGAWTHAGDILDLRYTDDWQVQMKYDAEGRPVQYLPVGMSLGYFHENGYPRQTEQGTKSDAGIDNPILDGSAEWDLISLTSERHEVVYKSCCGEESFIDISFYFEVRRKTLFYAVNLLFPCIIISFLTTFVFCLSEEKLTFSLSILITLVVFFLVLVDLIPPTSLVVPMFAQYLLVTMCMVTLSIVITVFSVDINYRTGYSHRMPQWVRKIFFEILPCILRVHIPKELHSKSDLKQTVLITPPPPILKNLLDTSPFLHRKFETKPERNFRLHKQILVRLLQHIQYIKMHYEEKEQEEKLSKEWSYVALVVDRLFLYVFMCTNLLTLWIFLQSPSISDKRFPLLRTSPIKPLGFSSLDDQIVF